MGREVTVELIVSPRAECVRSQLSEAPRWNSYVLELSRVFGTVIEASGVDTLEVGELLVSEPLADRHLGLRNGLEANLAEALDLVVGMASGHGPYCRLTSQGRLRVEAGWDGAVHFYVTPKIADDVVRFHGRDLRLERRIVAPGPVDVPRPVEIAADHEFWAGVRAVAGGVTLLCERWAYGAYGCRWFQVTPENTVDVAQAVRARSLLCVVVEPDLRVKPDMLDDGFTAFEAPLKPGELVFHSYPGGVDDIAEVVGEGLSLMISDSSITQWCVVVPDRDGVVRGRWEDPREH